MENNNDKIPCSICPKITVIMPAYNAAQYIEAAVRSVMGQTVSDWILLVIDDGSRDNTCEIVEKLAAEDERVHLLRNEQNMGVANTRNRGLALCRGEFAAFLDSDDIWLPESCKSSWICWKIPAHPFATPPTASWMPAETSPEEIIWCRSRWIFADC